MKRRSKYLVIVLTSIVYFWIGILKWNYMLNPWIVEGDFLLNRYSTEAQQNYNSSFSDGIRYFLLTPKWISTLLYGNAFLMLNLIIIYLVYEKQVYINFTFWLFFWVSFLSVSVLAVGLVTHTYEGVYPIVSRIKELQQSPFTLFLLLAAFKLHRGD